MGREHKLWDLEEFVILGKKVTGKPCYRMKNKQKSSNSMIWDLWNCSNVSRHSTWQVYQPEDMSMSGG